MRKISARDLIKIPIWHGNRIIDNEHKQEIISGLKGGIKSLDFKPFHVVTYPVEEEGEESIATRIVDGQHRASILIDSFKENNSSLDFDIIVVEKQCPTESAVQEYFKILNNTKAIPWKEDPNLKANIFVKALETAFNKNPKNKKVRHAANRPYLSIERLHAAILKYKVTDSGKTAEEFVEFAQRKNMELLEFYTSFKEKEKLHERALAMEFCLAVDEKLKWLEGF